MTPNPPEGQAERRELIERARDLLKPEAGYWAQHDSDEEPIAATLEAIACLLLAEALDA